MEKYKDKNVSIYLRVEDLLSKMTIEEKVGQCVQKPIFLETFNERYNNLMTSVGSGHCGSVILAFTAFAGEDPSTIVDIDVLNAMQKKAVENSRLGIPLIFGKDIIHGCRTTFPIPLAQAATWDYKLIRKAASIMAREANSTGVHWTFAPMLDICRDPRWGRIIETPGEDPFLGSMVAKAAIDGIQGDDMSNRGKLAACAKHYIGYGASEGGRDYQTTQITDYSLRNTYLKAFEAAVKNDVATVMASFNDIDGEPVSGSEHYIREILKDEMKFEGFVVSDWGSVSRLRLQGIASNNKECASLSMNAGVDMDMCTECYSSNIEVLLKESKLSEEYLNDAVRRILTVKMKLGLFENPYFDKNENVMTDDDIAHARKIAEHSMVLLKNDDILPIKPDTKVALVGPYANDKENMLGAWHADGNPNDVVTLLEAVTDVIGTENVIFKDNFVYDANHSFIRNADYVIAALGEGNYRSGEAHCVTDISLPNFQVDIVKQLHGLGKKVIAVVFAGRPLVLTEILPYVDAILYAWHPGIQAGNAVADILYGRFAPCGKLPVTFPASTGQIPMYYNNYSAGGYSQEYYTSNPTTYKVNYEDCLAKPLYQFGYGMSYNNYEYSAINSDKKVLTLEQINNGEKFNISLSVKNLGKYSSYEIVQLYIRDVAASRMRPVRELKAFEKVYIEAGREKQITFSIGKEELKFYTQNKKYEVEKGKFEVYIGGDCYAANMCEINVD